MVLIFELLVGCVSNTDKEALKPESETKDAKAQYNLGAMYSNGRDGARDYAEALEWFRKAAQQGDPDAQYNLCVAYRQGNEVSQDSVEAYKWCILAGSKASQIRMSMARTLSPKQMAEVEDRVAQFRAK